MFNVSILQASVETYSALETYQVPAVAFALDKETSDAMLVCFYLSILRWIGYYQKIIKWITVLETFVTHDVIISNLVLIFYTLCSSSVQTFLNVQKSLMRSSHQHHGQDKIVLSCLVSGVNRIGDKSRLFSVVLTAFRDSLFHSRLKTHLFLKSFPP